MNASILSVGFVMTVGIFLGILTIGILAIASSDIMLAIREIAINTRRETAGSQYRMLEIVAKVTMWLGCVIILGGVIIFIIMSFSMIKGTGQVINY